MSPMHVTLKAGVRIQETHPAVFSNRDLSPIRHVYVTDSTVTGFTNLPPPGCSGDENGSSTCNRVCALSRNKK